jgi:hypothetical protein
MNNQNLFRSLGCETIVILQCDLRILRSNRTLNNSRETSVLRVVIIPGNDRVGGSSLTKLMLNIFVSNRHAILK